MREIDKDELAEWERQCALAQKYHPKNVLEAAYKRFWMKVLDPVALSPGDSQP